MFEQFLALLLAAATPAGHARAADPAQIPPASVAKKPQAQDRIYGSQLMTPEERDGYRAKMRSAKTQAERDQLRAQHHDEMQARAKERGVTLPDVPRGPAHAAPRGRSGQGSGPGAGSAR